MTTSNNNLEEEAKRTGETTVQHEQTIDDATSRSSKGNKATPRRSTSDRSLAAIAFILSFFAVLVMREDDLELQVRIF
jgi:hypothetical protein